MGYNSDKRVSVDFNHDSLSGIFNSNHTRMIGRQAKVVAWCDNEWAFSNCMLDNTLALIKAAG